MPTFVHIYTPSFMKEKDDDKRISTRQTGSSEKNDLPGYPIYPASEDIFSRFLEEKEINPEDISKMKELNTEAGSPNSQNLNKGISGQDLDVPGSELDDELEEIGSEDEENNYYSLGGDNHTDLDENKG